MRLKEHISPSLVLFLLAPIVGELISGHTDVAAAFESQLGYLGGIGTMVKEGLLNVNTVYNVDGRKIMMLWLKFESIVKGFRDPSWGTPDYGENFEYLAEEMIRIARAPNKRVT